MAAILVGEWVVAMAAMIWEWCLLCGIWLGIKVVRRGDVGVTTNDCRHGAIPLTKSTPPSSTPDAMSTPTVSVIYGACRAGGGCWWEC